MAIPLKLDTNGRVTQFAVGDKLPTGNFPASITVIPTAPFDGGIPAKLYAASIDGFFITNDCGGP